MKIVKDERIDTIAKNARKTSEYKEEMAKMVRDNETVEQVCKVAKRLAKGSERCVEDNDLPLSVRAMHGKAAKNAVEFAERILAAHKREIAAKDAKITRLKSCLAGDCERMRLCAEPCANCHIERVNERNEIIKELADAIEWCCRQAESIGSAYLRKDFPIDALTITMAGMTRRCEDAISKLREVVK